MTRTVFLIAAVIICGCLGGLPTLAAAADVTGLFSDLRFVDEAGDLVGTEIFVVYSGEGYFAMVQVAEGTAGKPWLVPAQVEGPEVRFSIPRCGEFIGLVSASRLKGRFESCPNWMVDLPRKSSYWQQQPK
jgi:hypothetical protein